MSQSENCENLLIDFNNISVSNERPSDDKDRIRLATTDTLNDSLSSYRGINQILCSSQPLYKLLTESHDMDANNPFDHFDKQAGLLDDPFEIVENAALISSDSMAANTAGSVPDVKTATLISFDSTMSDTSKSLIASNDSQTTLCNETKLNDSVQNTSQKQMSATKNVSQRSSTSSPSSGSSNTRNKVKNSSVTLLKFSLSNSRLDLIAADNNVSTSGDENVCPNDAVQKKQKLEMRRDSGTDDSFDDIWSTIPNLVDSQTEIDIESDIDSDIAKLNIPMLKIAVPNSQYEENVTTDPIGSDTKESIELKAFNRSNILEKFASIKQKIPNSPAPIDATAVTSSSSPLILPLSSKPTVPHNQTVDIDSGNQLRENHDNETIMPATKYPPVEMQPHQNTTPNNHDSLIENLQRLVDQCDDKHKQMTAKHLLDDLSSILTKTIANEKNIQPKIMDDSSRQPPKIKRQGTFNIDRDSCSYLNNLSSDQDQTIRSNDGAKDETHVIDSEFSQVVKQIQNAFGSHQNINILQTNDQSMAMSSEVASVKPTFIVVMAPSAATAAPPPPAISSNQDTAFLRFQRSRSQSLTLKERPLAAMRASQRKIEQLRSHQVSQVTPIKSTSSQRRRSFGSISQLAMNNETPLIVKPASYQQPPVQPEVPKTPKILRRRSLQGAIEQSIEPEIVQSKPTNPVTRRRSFQPPSMTSGIRIPSPKKNFNLSRSSAAAPPRQSTYSMGMLARRKSFTTGEMMKDSPLKIKTSYGIMKKPAVPPVTRNLKIRVSQSTTGRSTAPLRAVVPMKQVTPLHLINDTVAPVDDKRKMSTLITSTPRSIPSPIKLKTDPVESPIQNLHENSAFMSTPPNTSAQPTISNVAQRRRTISDYRSQVNTSSVTVTVDSNSNPGGKISTLKNATKSLATGLSRFTAKRMSSIGLKRPSSSGSKENKKP